EFDPGEELLFEAEAAAGTGDNALNDDAAECIETGRFGRWQHSDLSGKSCSRRAWSTAWWEDGSASAARTPRHTRRSPDELLRTPRRVAQKCGPGANRGR